MQNASLLNLIGRNLDAMAIKTTGLIHIHAVSFPACALCLTSLNYYHSV